MLDSNSRLKDKQRLKEIEHSTYQSGPMKTLRARFAPQIGGIGDERNRISSPKGEAATRACFAPQMGICKAQCSRSSSAKGGAAPRDCFGPQMGDEAQKIWIRVESPSR